MGAATATMVEALAEEQFYDGVGLGYQPHVDFLKSGALFKLFQGGRGSGKTLIGVFEVRRYVKSHPGAIFICTEPIIQNVRDILKKEFDKQFALAGELGTFVDWRASENKYLFKNGSEIWLRQCKEPETLRGPTGAGVWMDEAASCPHEAFKLLVPTMRQKDAKGKPYPYVFIVTGTPKGKNWVHWVFNQGDRPKQAPPYIGDELARHGIDCTVEKFFGTSLQPYLDEITKASIQAAYPVGTRAHEQEVLGKTVTYEGVIYDGFDPVNHVREMPPETCLTRTIGILDWGWYPDPGVLLVLSQDTDGVIWLRYEVAEAKTPVLGTGGQRDWLGICVAARKKYGIEKFVADPSLPDHLESLRRGDQNAPNGDPRTYGLNIEGAQNAILPGINVVSSFIGADQWIVDPDCENSLAEVSAFCWKQDRTGEQLKQEPEKGGDHSMDCWRYGAMAFARPAAVFAEAL